MSDSKTTRYVIEPVTRVEGHGKVSILLDENKKVKQARLHIVEFRGFERFIQGLAPICIHSHCPSCGNFLHESN